MARNGEVVVDENAAGAVHRRAQRFSEIRRGDAGGPENRSGLNDFAPDVNLAGRDVRHDAPRPDGNAQPFERSTRKGREVRRVRRQHGRSAFDEDHARRLRIDIAKVVRQRVSRDFRERARELHARGTAADHDERQEPPLDGPILLALGLLEGQEHPPPHLERVLECLQAGSVFPPVVVTKVRVCRARRQDEVVVRHLAVVKHEHAALEVHTVRLRQPDPEVPLFAQDPADGRGNVAGRQPGGRDLVQERLEDVVVAPIDEQDIDRRVFQGAGGAQAAKAAADDDDSGTSISHVPQVTTSSRCQPSPRQTRECRPWP